MEAPRQIVLVLSELERHTHGHKFHEENIAVWKSDGCAVHVHLMQQAVELVLGGSARLAVPAGVRVTVDPFSLEVRGAQASRLPGSVETLDMDGLVMALGAAGTHTLWY
jgi:hypothetical protein